MYKFSSVFNFLFWNEPLVLVFNFKKIDRTPNTILKIVFGICKYFGSRDFPKKLEHGPI
jgi:hypothetical protein